jgi:hypothetical protein
MHPLILHTVLKVLSHVCKLLSTKKPNMSTMPMTHKGFSFLPPRELIDESLTILAKWWLWLHNHKDK